MVTVNTLINEEAKETYEKNNPKKQFYLETDTLLSLWHFVIAHSEITNLVAESEFLIHFNIYGSYDQGVGGFLLTTFIGVVTNLIEDSKKEEEKYGKNFNLNYCVSDILTSEIS